MSRNLSQNDHGYGNGHRQEFQRQGRSRGQGLGQRQGRSRGQELGQRQEQTRRQGWSPRQEQGSRQEQGQRQERGQRQGREHKLGNERWQEQGQEQHQKEWYGQGQKLWQGQWNQQGPTSASHHSAPIKFLLRDDITALAQSTSADVVTCINENESGFLAAYKHEKYCQHPLMLKHLIKILYLLSKHEDFNRIAPRILARILSADGSYALFIMKLDLLIKGMVTETRGHIRKENPLYINYLIEIGSKAITIIPETVLNTYPLLVLQTAIRDLVKQGDSLNTLERKMDALDQAFKMAKEEQSKHRKRNIRDAVDYAAEPPAKYVCVEILPDRDEIHSSDEKIDLKPNIVKGPYRNWDHYLDVQYHLLREDFVRPLRHGIQQYSTFKACSKKRACSKKPIQDLKVYEKVRVLNSVCLFTGIGFQLQFDVSNFKRVKWEYSRRLIFGSLLCLSNDNFEHSILFATVVQRDPDLLKDGYLVVKFEGHINGFQIDPNEIFTMVESSAYFEAYSHVLEKLKDISSTKDTMPFKPYIIESNLTNIRPPSYLQHKGIKFDIGTILSTKSKSHIAINDESSWPSAETTCLDESQLAAMKMALTKELSVIQGPPGTGKTFIGLKIVEVLLQNRSVWDRNKEAPILVVCYTNHALDQFLEGIQKMSIFGQSYESDEPNIVRVGGRCKSSKLSSCVLGNKVKECISAKKLSRELRRSLCESRDQMFSCKKFISNLLKHDTKRQQFLHLSDLKVAISKKHISQLTEVIYTEQDKEIEMWLELWYPTFDWSVVQLNQNFEDISDTRDLQQESEEKVSDDCIDVDTEIQLMEEDRILEGEEIVFSPTTKSLNQQPETKIKPNRADKDSWITKRNQLIQDGLKSEPMTSEEAEKVYNIWYLSLKERWQLYCFWLKEYAKYCHDQTRHYENACKRYSDSREKVAKYVLCSTDVIGMTTTGAAKHRHILEMIHPKVVIFEEAAEIFEAHIITSLAPSVQQLILIGDHKQLRPKPNSFDLEHNYELAVSLFERLVRNGAPYVTLDVQHRMRPEISRLIHPSIYSDLKDHKSVTEFGNILGIAKDVFMIDHHELEVSNRDNDVTTHVNKFEADYLVALCRYILKQGYQPTEITILTMYRGQLLELKQKMKRKDFEGVRIAAVDDFQGEENDIILLSLVRSNPEGVIGFLSNSNRICVSLSRARKGLYLIGNLSMLRDKVNTVWPAIISDLEEQNCVENALPLYCRVHQKNKVFAAKPEDFLKCPEGGCEERCATKLSCGHSCPRICHPIDSDHKRYKCLQHCPWRLPCGHECKHKCYECTPQGCGPCSVSVNKIIPQCHHEVKMLCHSDPDKYPCPVSCNKTLQCGHPCRNLCSAPCTLSCNVKVIKTLECGHLIECFCHQTLDQITCPEKCSAELECGHPCIGTCGKCSRGRLHERCRHNCGRQLVCGHTCNFPCASTCPPCMKLCNNSCIHSHCRKLCYEPCTPCMEPCKWKCKHFKCTQLCGELCNRPPCNEPCEKILKCGHPCIGLCGEKCPKLCRICDKEKVCEVFFGTEEDESARFVTLEDCGHLFEVESLDKWIGEENNQSGKIQFKTCPKCRTPVRKSLRYCNEVKLVLRDVEEIKCKQLISEDDMMESLRAFNHEASISGYYFFIKSEAESLNDAASQKYSHPCHRISALHPCRINDILAKIAVLRNILAVRMIISDIEKSTAAKLESQLSICNLDHLLDSLKIIKRFIMQEFLSPQQVSEAMSECQRVSCGAKLCDLLCKLCKKNCSLGPEDRLEIFRIAEVVHESGWKRERLNDEKEAAILEVIKGISETYQVDGLSKKERNMIVKAIGLTKGHWFKCPNGHYYCIGECGGAMQTSKCPDCGATIGGQQHRLIDDNIHAPEMDHSSHPAWSEAANMANFDPNQLF